MDESDLQVSGDEEVNLRKIEKDVDEFLLSIKENEAKSTDIQNEGVCSKVHDEYDIISSDDCFENMSLPSRNDGPSSPGCVRKLPYRPFRNKCKMGKGNVKNYGKSKLWSNFPRKEWHRHNGRELGQISREHHHQKRFPPRWRDESFSPSSEEFQQERSLSPKSNYDREQSFSPRGRKEHQGVRGVSPHRKSKYPQQRKFIPRGNYRYKRNFYQEDVDKVSQDHYVFEKRDYPHERTFASRSRTNDDGNASYRELSRGSKSPIDWSESYDYDSDYESWRCEESHPYTEDRNDQSAASQVATILQKAIAHNPDIATKVTKICLALISKPAESNFDYDRDSWAAHQQQSGEVFRQSWHCSRSPSFSKSLDALSNHSGFSRHSDRFHSHSKRSVLERSISPDDTQAGRDKYNFPDRHIKERYSPYKRLDDTWPSAASEKQSARKRFHGHSKRIVLEDSISPDDRQAERDKCNYPDRHKKENYSSDYKSLDDRRPSVAASETHRARKRTTSEPSKNHFEEEFDLKGAVSWSIKKIKKRCKTEEISVVRHALLSLLEMHKRECKIYMKKPEAHPDHRKEYRKFVNQKTRAIVDLGGDPNGYDFEQDWKRYWPVQMYKLFQESWNTKMHNCTSMLQNMCGSGSESSHSSSRTSSSQQSHEKRKTHEQGSEEETVDMEGSIKKVKTSKTKKKLSEVTHLSLEDQQILCKKQEKLKSEIFSILKLLNHIKHRFQDCEESFDKLFVKAMSLKEDNVAIDDVLQGELALLKKIDIKLKETLKDVSLTIIQKAVIQETHERFRSFLKKNKESHST